MYVVTLNDHEGAFGPFETEEDAGNWLAGIDEGKVLEIIPVDHCGLIP